MQCKISKFRLQIEIECIMAIKGYIFNQHRICARCKNAIFFISYSSFEWHITKWYFEYFKYIYIYSVCISLANDFTNDKLTYCHYTLQNILKYVLKFAIRNMQNIKASFSLQLSISNMSRRKYR